MLLLEPSTPTQHDSIPSNQSHFRSLGCQLHVSKSSPKINLALRSGRAPVRVLLRFIFLLAKYDDARLSSRHFKSEKNFERGSERISITYAIVTAISKVKLKPWCCRLFSIHGFLALILFTVTNTLLTAVCCKSELRYLKH